MNWYRVQALNFDTKGVDIICLDFGHRANVSLTSLHSLEGKFISLPFQAVCCSIAGIRSTVASGAWTAQAVDWFKELIVGNNLHGIINQVDDQHVRIELSTESTSDAAGEIIASQMVERGLAEYVPNLPVDFFQMNNASSSDTTKYSFVPFTAFDVSRSAPRRNVSGGNVSESCGKLTTARGEEFKKALDTGMIAETKRVMEKEGTVKSSTSQVAAIVKECPSQVSPLPQVSPLVKQNSSQSITMVKPASSNTGPVVKTVTSLVWSDIPVTRLCIGQSYTIMITLCDAVDNLFVQVVSQDDVALFQRLTNRLSTLYVNSTGAHAPTLLGELVAAKFTDDGSWYRAVVKNILSTGRIVVDFVDFGNSDELPPSELRRIDPSVVGEYPKQAHRCVFVGMDLLKAGKPWDCSYLKPFCTTYTMRVVSFKEDEVYVMELFINEGDVLINMKDRLIVDGYFVVKNLDIQRNATAGALSNGAHTPLEPASRHQAHITETKVIHELKLDDHVTITFVNGLHDFYMQLDAHQGGFVVMMREVIAHCSSSPQYVPQGVGEIVGALYSDGNWYRAVTLSPPTQGSIHVAFIDYGNSEDINVTNIRSIPSKLGADMPAWAVPCLLFGFSDTACVELDTLFKENECMPGQVVGHCLRSGDRFLVDLKIGDSSETLGKKYAKYASVNEHPRVITSRIEMERNRGTVKEVVVPLPEVQRHNGPSGDHFPADLPGLKSTVNTAPPFSNQLAPPKPPQQGAPVVVIHFVSPSEFYIQHADSNSLRERSNLFTVLLNASSSAARLTEPTQLKKGELVLVFHEDDWYRVELLEVKKDKVVVNFVDFGNVDEVCLTNVRVLSRDFINILPRQAMKCRISGLVGSGPDGAWTEAAIHWFSNTCMDVFMEVASVESERAQEHFMIDLSRETMPFSIRAHLLDLGHAKVANDRMARQPTSPAGVTPGHVGLDSHPSVSAQRLVNNPNSQAVEKSPVVTLTANHEIKAASATPQVMTASHTPQVMTASVSLPQVTTVSATPPCQVVMKSVAYEAPPGIGATVSIVHMNTPDDFYVQLEDEATKQRLAKLFSELYTVCSTRTSWTNFSSFSLGEIVAGKFEDYWYRAEVLELTAVEIKLLFIDYGNTASITDAASVQKLDEQFADVLPRQAIHCRLEGIQANEGSGQWSPAANEFFKSSNEGNIRVIKSTDTIVNHVYPIDLGSAESITTVVEDMIQKRFGFPVSSVQHAPAVGDKVLVVYVTDPSDFYVQFVTSQQEINDVLCHVISHALAAPAYKPTLTGEHVAALFEGGWYRAQVLQLPATGKVKVQYFDYGNTGYVDVGDIRALPMELVYASPRQAILCKISGISPESTSQGSNPTWTPEAVNWFKVTTENNCFTVVSVVDNNGRSISLDLKSSDESKSIATELVARKFAKTDENQVTSMSLLQRGDSVVVCHVNTPTSFYVQNISSSVVSRIKSLQMISILTDRLKTTAETTYRPSMIGDLVAAREDNMWFRAEVKKIDAENACVHFVDFGNTDNVKFSDLRRMPAAFAEGVPGLAIRCEIVDVVGCGAGGKWGTDCIDWMIDNCENETFVVTTCAVGVEGQYLVDLSGAPAPSVRALLLSRSLAVAACSSSIVTSPPGGVQKPSTGRYCFDQLPMLVPSTGVSVNISVVIDPWQFYCYDVQTGD